VLRLDGRGYSPTTLFKITEASAKLHSHDAAAYAVGLTGLQISPRHVCSIATEIGLELAAARDDKVVLQRQRKLPTRVANPPVVVAVEVDGGRLGTRQPGCGPGVHQPGPKEDKIACLVSLTGETYAEDPQPQPPPSLMQPRRVQRLVRQIHGSPGDMFQEEQGQEDTDQTAAQTAAEEAHARTSPVKRLRTCVASLRDVHAFGPMVAAEAQERGFHQALRQAFLGDGQASNWTIHKRHFKDYRAIADFMHVICYLYVTAWAAGGSPEEQWSRYLEWLRSCWQGRVVQVIGEVEVWQQRLGEPPEGEELAANDPQRLLAETLSYLRNNQERMDYPRYRQEGLPVTSSLVESLVGEFNARLKSKQKYWDRLEGQGGEAMLQLRAAVLSEDDRLARHFAQRPGNPYRRRYPAKKLANVS
jgi:hypothetical protein